MHFGIVTLEGINGPSSPLVVLEKPGVGLTRRRYGPSALPLPNSPGSLSSRSSRTKVLKWKCVQESPGSLWKMVPIPGPHLQGLWLSGSGMGPRDLFLTTSDSTLRNTTLEQIILNTKAVLCFQKLIVSSEDILFYKWAGFAFASYLAWHTSI